MAMPHLLRRWIKNRLSLGNSRKKTASRNKTRLLLEALEKRVVPATNISILATANGTGTLDAFLSPVSGTITTADDPGDPAATLSRGALESVGPGVTISITADNAISFNDLAALNLQTGGGTGAGKPGWSSAGARRRRAAYGPAAPRLTSRRPGRSISPGRGPRRRPEPRRPACTPR